MEDRKTLSDQVRQTAYDIHVYHGHGHFEKVYENALAHRLRKSGLDVKQQQAIKVYFGSYKFEIRKFVWSDHSKMQPTGIALTLLSAFFAFFVVNCLLCG